MQLEDIKITRKGTNSTMNYKPSTSLKEGVGEFVEGFDKYNK
ncbi:hypothetical protein Q4553_02510 [Tenacibaculum soleae]|nr:hypothetical protein [Tenacibaculum soleae]MDO6743436.1 hypothetical protein [Tenacibaculum soleae]